MVDVIPGSAASCPQCQDGEDESGAVEVTDARVEAEVSVVLNAASLRPESFGYPNTASMAMTVRARLQDARTACAHKLRAAVIETLSDMFHQRPQTQTTAAS